MKLLKTAIICFIALFTLNFTINSKSAFIKPPKLIKGTVEDLKVLKNETLLDLKFDYSVMEVAKMTEAEWVAKQKKKDVEDEKKATEEFNAFWYKEVVPYQEEKYVTWYNDNCQTTCKVAKGAKAKYSLTLKPTILNPSGGFSTLAALTSHAVITEIASGKVIAILEIPNVQAGVPAMKERVALTYGATAKAVANFMVEALSK